MEKVTVYWKTRNVDDQRRIRERLGITAGTTVNGETPAIIGESEMPILRELQNRGFIQIRPYKQKLDSLLR